MKTKFTLLPWVDSNHRSLWCTFTDDLHQSLVSVQALCQLSYTAFHIYFSGSRLMQVPNPA